MNLRRSTAKNRISLIKMSWFKPNNVRLVYGALGQWSTPPDCRSGISRVRISYAPPLDANSNYAMGTVEHCSCRFESCYLAHFREIWRNGKRDCKCKMHLVFGPVVITISTSRLHRESQGLTPCRSTMSCSVNA